MPRPMKNRDPFGERNVAARVALERERRGMTYDGLAKRMADAGCEIHSSALYKIEKGDPPRRITVTELLGFSKVLELPLAELVADPNTYLPQHVFELVDKAARLESRGWRLIGEGTELTQKAREVVEEARVRLQSSPEVLELVESLIAASAEPNRLHDAWRDVASEFEAEELAQFAGAYNSVRRARPMPSHKTALGYAAGQRKATADVAARMFLEVQARDLLDYGGEDQ